MKNQNIYRNNNQTLKETLSMYKPQQLLYVPIEIGKFNHKTSTVNFLGDIIVKPFEFPNNKHGLNFFVKQLNFAKSSTDAQKIFLGCESTGHYHLNLIHHLKLLNFPVEIINPRDVRKENPNKNSKTDFIDLNAIARVLISNKGGRQIVPEGVYYNLQRASRTRRKFVRLLTSVKNIITSLVDRIFPGLWDKDDSIFSQRFSKASMLILENYPHPEQIIRLGEKRLAQFLRKNNTKLGDETAHKIISIAKDTLTKPQSELAIDILALKSYIKCFQLYSENISQFEKEIARLIIQTPGSYLLSIDGISVVYAAEFTAEVGDIHRFAYANQIISFAGSCPRVFESAEYQAQGLPISKRGSKFLRTALNQIALTLNAWCEPFHQYYTKKALEKSDRPGIARIATGNKFVKLAFALMKYEQLYKHRGLILDEKSYYANLWNKITRKLNGFDLTNIPQKNNYLLKIKKFIEEKI
ncbi:MAG: IS110 family transposase [Elusimicrobiota bacterium]